MRRAIAKQSRVRTFGNHRSPNKRMREGRALPVLRAVPINAERRSRSALSPALGEPAAASFVPIDNGVLP
jgi:hypothetical protein